MISRRTGVGLVGFTIAVAAAAALVPRVPQPQSYHDFADPRTLLGIPNFLDVASNLLFVVSGAAGFWILRVLQERQPAQAPGSAKARLLHFIDEAAGNDGGHGRAFEGPGVERRVAGLAGGLLYVIGPREIVRKNGQIGGLARPNPARNP